MRRGDVEYPLHEADIRYSDGSRLNTYQVCLPRPLDELQSGKGDPPEQLWVVFIHGGAWYDPSQDATCFNKAQSLLLDQSSYQTALASIAGFASLNYRLSPPPTDNGETPADPSDIARQAHHPDHIQDVLEALAHLQARHPSARRYILAGHSCGATLAMQVAMSRNGATPTRPVISDVSLPVAILGVAGIYDLPALVKWHAVEPFYAEFVRRAFGTHPEVWQRVSPTSELTDWQASWPGSGLIVLAHSREDELVEWEQVELMMKATRKQGFAENPAASKRLELLEITGRHRQIWEEGMELARAVEFTVAQVS